MLFRMDAIFSHLTLDELKTARSDIASAVLSFGKAGGRTEAQVRMGGMLVAYHPSELPFLKELAETIGRLIARKESAETRPTRGPIYVELG